MGHVYIDRVMLTQDEFTLYRSTPACVLHGPRDRTDEEVVGVDPALVVEVCEGRGAVRGEGGARSRMAPRECVPCIRGGGSMSHTIIIISHLV